MITPAMKQACIDESKDYALIRSKERLKSHGEIFTPTALVIEMLEQLPIVTWEQGKTYLDPTCGNGQFLSAVLIIKQSLGHIDALKTIYGVDIMQDNVDDTRRRLCMIAGVSEENISIAINNIRCEDGLKYDYSALNDTVLCTVY